MFRTSIAGLALAAAACHMSAGDGTEQNAASAQALEANDAGVPVMECFWDGGYDYVTHSCHQAANEGLDAGNLGIISCEGNTSGPGGHTINYDFIGGQTCLADPQLPGSAACCWPGGPPVDLTSPLAQACLAALCPGFVNAVALPPGEPYPTHYLECADRTSTRITCDECCVANANAIPISWGDAALDDRQHYLQGCLAACAPKRSCSGDKSACEAQADADVAACHGQCPWIDIAGCNAQCEAMGDVQRQSCDVAFGFCEDAGTSP